MKNHVLVVFMSLLLWACGSNVAEPPVEQQAAPPAARDGGPPPASQIGQAENTLVMRLKYGNVRIRLRPDLAPNHARRIKRLVREKFYDGHKFHRVIEGFMAQTGDPTGTGTGGSKYPDLRAEFSRAPFTRGVVGMARASSPDSANSQFFIMYADANSLDGKYTVIGDVVSGMEFVDQIKRGEPPANPDTIISLRLASDVR